MGYLKEKRKKYLKKRREIIRKLKQDQVISNNLSEQTSGMEEQNQEFDLQHVEKLSEDSTLTQKEKQRCEHHHPFRNISVQDRPRYNVPLERDCFYISMCHYFDTKKPFRQLQNDPLASRWNAEA